MDDAFSGLNNICVIYLTLSMSRCAVDSYSSKDVSMLSRRRKERSCTRFDECSTSVRNVLQTRWQSLHFNIFHVWGNFEERYEVHKQLENVIDGQHNKIVWFLVPHIHMLFISFKG